MAVTLLLIIVLTSFRTTSLSAIGLILRTSVIPDSCVFGISHTFISVSSSSFNAHFITRSTTNFKTAFSVSVPRLKSSMAIPEGPPDFPSCICSSFSWNSTSPEVSLILDHFSCKASSFPLSIALGTSLWRNQSGTRSPPVYFRSNSDLISFTTSSGLSVKAFCPSSSYHTEVMLHGSLSKIFCMKSFRFLLKDSSKRSLLFRVSSSAFARESALISWVSF
eukprot:Lithocolla_globosa_v1_NODE_22_length_9343_cov_54.984819.p5 type:complete len:221 gc:universal NODE_22_length_9343_cov_54.984819:6908-6246(-)